MEFTYKTDLYSSYLLITVDDSLSHNKYSFKMLENNRIKGVLECKKRMEDGKTYLYLDITGKKNLSQEYRDREMSFFELTDLFQNLIIILEALREYLLTERMVIFEPEFIYRDIESGNLLLAVVPWEREEEYPLRKLAEFLLEKINHLEENGVSAAYHFYRSQSQPQFSIYQFQGILEKENILNRQKENALEVKEIEGDKKEENLIMYEEKEENYEIQESVPSSFFWVLSMISSLGILCLTFLPFIKKNQKLACFVLSAVLMIIGIGSKIIREIKQRNENKSISPGLKDEQEYYITEGEETVFFTDTSPVTYLQLQWKEKGKQKEMEIKDLPITIGKKKEQVSLMLSDPSVSRIHCRIIEHEGEPALIDLGSTNGTYLNGIRLNKEEILQIEKNDEILIGKVKLLVV